MGWDTGMCCTIGGCPENPIWYFRRDVRSSSFTDAFGIAMAAGVASFPRRIVHSGRKKSRGIARATLLKCGNFEGLVGRS
jgi:hypothetical protein